MEDDNNSGFEWSWGQTLAASIHEHRSRTTEKLHTYQSLQDALMSFLDPNWRPTQPPDYRISRGYLDAISRGIKKISIAISSNGGLDIQIGTYTIHAPKYLSVHYPLIQMVLFARKSMVHMVESSSSSASPDAASEGTAGCWQLPEQCMPAADDIHGGSGSDEDLIGTADIEETQASLNHQIDSSTTTLFSTAASLDEQLILHDQGNELCSNLHYGAAAATTCLEETVLDPVALHELTETEFQQSAADSVTADRAIAKAEEASASATWVVATAAPHHATGNLDLLSGFTHHHCGFFLHAADGTPMQVLGSGNVVTNSVVLPDVWYVPGLTANLVSVSQLAELDYSVGFGRAECYIRSPDDGGLVGSARVGDEGLFEVDFLKVK